MTRTLGDLFAITPAELEALLPGGGGHSSKGGGPLGLLRKVCRSVGPELVPILLSKFLKYLIIQL